MTVRDIQVAGVLQVTLLRCSVASEELGVAYVAPRTITDVVTREMKRTGPGWVVVSFRLKVTASKPLPSLYEAHSLAGWLDRRVDWKCSDIAAIQSQVRETIKAWGCHLPRTHQDALQARG